MRLLLLLVLDLTLQMMFFELLLVGLTVLADDLVHILEDVTLLDLESVDDVGDLDLDYFEDWHSYFDIVWLCLATHLIDLIGLLSVVVTTLETFNFAQNPILLHQHAVVLIAFHLSALLQLIL